jgi:hypothetical protein
MNIKDNIGKIIIWGNVAIVAIIYTIAANINGGQILGFFCTCLQMIIMLGAAVILSVIHLVTKKTHPTLGKAMKASWVSSALVIAISFPVCLGVGYINPVRW